jgi:hypothetical protein
VGITGADYERLVRLDEVVLMLISLAVKVSLFLCDILRGSRGRSLFARHIGVVSHGGGSLIMSAVEFLERVL